MKRLPTLQADTVAAIKGMLLRNDRLVDIAVFWRLSPSTVHSVKKGKVKAYRHIAPAPPEVLPPRGPYVVVARAEYEGHREAVQTAVASKAQLIADLEKLLESYRKGNDNAEIAEGQS